MEEGTVITILYIVSKKRFSDINLEMRTKENEDLSHVGFWATRVQGQAKSKPKDLDLRECCMLFSSKSKEVSARAESKGRYQMGIAGQIINVSLVFTLSETGTYQKALI